MLINSMEVEHVLGHQDDNTDFRLLDSIAQGNFIADYLATRLLGELTMAPPDSPILWTPYSSIGEKLVCGNIEKSLLEDSY